jgi:hypothetical protein
MKYYEYDTEGWLIGWHEDANRPNSTSIEPTVSPAFARWNGSAWLEDSSMQAEEKKVRLDAAWEAADKHAQQMDNNSRTSLLWIYYDPTTSQTCKDMIIAAQVWWASVWNEYGRVKALIEAGQAVEYDPGIVGNCPYTIWQINASR